MFGVPLSCGIVFFVLHLIDRVPCHEVTEGLSRNTHNKAKQEPPDLGGSLDILRNFGYP